ncbi:MAG TPA: amino acid adenylation domain-containing protein [Pseudonocardiaceae bacterium]|jgi:amino acid adenylation domain-containing protein/non-ribosomal peptide synthase protein (TIGR01720 family)
MEGYRLSPQQKRAWQVRQADPTGTYPAQVLAEIGACADVERLRRAVDAVCVRHEALRTTLRQPAGLDLPIQVIAPAPLVVFGVHEDGDVASLARSRAASGVDLDQGPLVFADLVLRSDERALLLMTTSALLADTISLHHLIADVERAYDGVPGQDEPLQYADAAEWQHDVLSATETEGERAVWRERCAALPPAAILPFERDVPSDGFRCAAVPVPLAPDTVRQGLRLAVDRGWPADAVFAAAWQVLLARIAGGPVRVALAGRNRPHEEMRDAVGSYAQWLPHGTAIAPDRPFAQVVTEVVDQAQDLLHGQEFFDPATVAGLPVARAGFAWTELPASPGWRVTFAVSHREPFVVQLAGTRVGDELTLTLHHDATRLPGDDAHRLADAYRHLVAAAVRDPDATVSTLPTADSAELRRAVADSRPTRTISTVHCVPELISAQTASRPDALAVVAGDARLTYRELNERANQIAHRLRRAGVAAEDRVAVVAERGTDLVAAILGVWKSGGAYVPIDPSLPVPRSRLLLAQADARVVLADRHLLDHAPDAATAIDLAGADLAAEPVSEPGWRVRADQLAYVIFTSGSTGEPKAVAVTHDSLARYVLGIADVLDLPAGATYGLVSTFAADLGHTVVFPSLCTGGVLHLLSREVANSADLLAAYTDRAPLDCLKIVPSHLRALLDGARPASVLPRLRLVLGGEAAPADLVRRVYELVPGCRVLNHYGPTETTVGVLSHETTRDETRIPLGRPLPHAVVHVLDDRLTHAPLWTEGEVFVGGPSVARGYLGRPGATAERFVPDPYADRPGGRLYRTGDRARRRADGTLMFLGRVDEQVKLRGYRVEPAEVAAVLRRHPAVRDAVAVVRDGEAGAPRLVGYAVADTSTEALHEYCAAQLPDYLVPSALVLLDAIPLTSNGKLDRAALPAPTSDTAYAPPRSPTESALAAIWAELLRVDRVGRDDNFFALGGDSILGIQVVSRAAAAGISVTPPLLFQHPTIAGLAAASEHAGPTVAADQDAVTGPVPPTPIQRWFLDQQMPDRSRYNQTICLKPRRRIEAEPLRAALRALLSHHDALRLRLYRDPDGHWALDNSPDNDHDVLDTATDDLDAAARQAQDGIDVGSGRLLRAALVATGAGQRLVLVAHHLGVDGVSWRVLLDDLTTAYRQAAAGEQIRLPAKTTSYQEWARRLAARARDHDGEIPHWTEVLTTAHATRLPRDRYRDDATDTYGTSRSVTVTLTDTATADLLRASGQTPVHSAVLGALGRALCAHAGQHSVVVDVERHGREQLWDDVDLTRTVGWFTAVHPVILRADGTMGAPAPEGGIGYGLLRHLRTDTATARLRALPAPEIRVNYLGHGDQESGDALVDLLPDRLGSTTDPGAKRPYLLDITAVVLGERLHMTWTYSPAAHDEQTIAALATDCLHLLDGEPTGANTEQDGFAESGLNDDDLAALIDELDMLPAEGEV